MEKLTPQTQIGKADRYIQGLLIEEQTAEGIARANSERTRQHQAVAEDAAREGRIVNLAINGHPIPVMLDKPDARRRGLPEAATNVQPISIPEQQPQ